MDILRNVKITVEDPDFLPVYKTEGAACMDCKADVISTIGNRAYDSEDTLGSGLPFLKGTL